MNRNPILVFFAVIGIFVTLVIVLGIVFLYSAFGKRPSLVRSDSIGIVKVEGIIIDSEPILKTLRKFKEDNYIKAIVVRIDSPGGVVGPSQEIYNELKKIQKTKKVVASMGALGASGAYYIACGTEKIVANPGTLTGSVGVIMEFANLQKLYQWAKMDHTVIKSGKFKDVGSPFRPMNVDEKELLNQLVLNVSEQFQQTVLSNRKINPQDVSTIMDGRVLTGEQAKQLGLIDQLGNFHDAVDIAKDLSGIKGEPALVYPEKERMIFLRYFVDESVLQWFEKMTSQRAISSPLLYLMPVS